MMEVQYRSIFVLITRGETVEEINPSTSAK